MSPAVADLETQAARLLDSGQVPRAHALAQQLLRAQPRNAWGLAVLGMTAYTNHEYDEALRYMQQAISRDKTQQRFYCYLGSVQVARLRLREALIAFDKALRLKPEDLLAVSGKAGVLERQGRNSRARALIEPWIKRKVMTGKMLAAYARLLLAEKDYDTIITTVEPLRAGQGLEPGIKRALHLICGRAYDARGDLERAWALFTTGNTLDAHPFDGDTAERLVQHSIDGFSAEIWPTLTRAQNRSTLPVFLIGMPRSGTTLVEQIIHAHPKAHGAGEVVYLRQVLGSMSIDMPDVPPLPEGARFLTADQLDALAEQYLEQLRSHDRRAERIVDKALQYHLIPMISLMFPEARILHVHRHPMDSCLSCYMNNLDPATHRYSSRLEDLGVQYRLYRRLMKHFRDVLCIDMLDVQYEDVIADQEAQTRRILDYLGLAWDDRCLTAHKAKRDVGTISYRQVNQPVYTSAMGRWRRYEQHLHPLRDALGDLLDSNGNEVSDHP